MLLHHFQSLPLDFSITQNPSQNQLFLKECWFFHEKSSFSCRVGNFFTSQYGTYECVLWVLNTLGHNLKLLGPNFLYRLLFWKKKNFFRPPWPQNAPNPYKILIGWAQKWFVGRHFFDFLKVFQIVPKWCTINLGWSSGSQGK